MDSRRKGKRSKALFIRKNTAEGISVNRIRNRLLSSVLLNPSSTPSQSHQEEGTSEDAVHGERKEDEGEGEEEVVVEIDDKEGEDFVPSIKIKRVDDSILIDTNVLKDVSLTSDLFRILEEEKLDVVYENQYRSETKVSHTILVRLAREQYDVDALKAKLCSWAGN